MWEGGSGALGRALLRLCSRCLTISGVQAELNAYLKDYVGRETPLYYAKRLSEHYRRCAGARPPAICMGRDARPGGGIMHRRASLP